MLILELSEVFVAKIGMANSMNILFAISAAPGKSPFFTNEKKPPLGLGSLMSLVRNKGKRGVKICQKYL